MVEDSDVGDHGVDGCAAEGVGMAVIWEMEGWEGSS